MYDSIAALVRQEGWRAEGDAARVHYDGGDDRFAVEFYADPGLVLYWTVPAGDGADPADASSGTTAERAESEATPETAVPVPRARVPDPLRRRIREDLAAAGADPAVERDPI